MNEIFTLPIQKSSDTIMARMKVREFARAQGLNITDQARISLATHSLVGALGLGGSYQGQIVVSRLAEGERMGVKVLCVTANASDRNFALRSFTDVKWLVDELSVEALPLDELQITLIQWATSGGRIQSANQVQCSPKSQWVEKSSSAS
jgi:hypothetical protein